MFANAFGEGFTNLRQQKFGIPQTANAVLGLENHRGGDHRSKESATANFIDAGNKLGSVSPGQFLVARRALKLLEETKLERRHRPLLLTRFKQLQIFLRAFGWLLLNRHWRDISSVRCGLGGGIPSRRDGHFEITENFTGEFTQIVRDDTANPHD